MYGCCSTIGTMAKRMVSIRLSAAALEDLNFCVEAAKRRQSSLGFAPASQGEIVEQALARLARYYRGLKLPAGKGAATKKK